jgi:fructose-bisphosphate aldolase class I
MESKLKFKEELIKTANRIVRPGYGILAADESTGTIANRFQKFQIESTADNRRIYRELLFTSEGLENYISGVILFEETVDTLSKNGKPLPQILIEKGIIPGIKLDKGTAVIGGTDSETFTKGLDDLAERSKKFYEKGCRFAKWRSVLKIGKGLPSELAIAENAHTLARYASICQDNGLVPIVEPEVLADGAHTIEECAEACERVFAAVMKALIDQKVLLEGILLKPNMITPGTESHEKKTAQEIAWFTVRTLSRTITPAVPGIVFLSGGQSEEEASLNLSAINALQGIHKPWSLSFSFGRALQQSCLKAWAGKDENIKKGQDELLRLAKANHEAQLGKYAGSAGANQESLHVKNYIY